MKGISVLNCTLVYSLVVCYNFVYCFVVCKRACRKTASDRGYVVNSDIG